MKFRGRLLDKRPFEVYFTPNGTDHHFETKIAGEHDENIKASQNWFYYWSTNRQGTTPAVCAYAFAGANPAILFDVRANEGLGLQSGDNVWLLSGVVTPATQTNGFNAAPAFDNGRVMKAHFKHVKKPPENRLPQLAAAEAQATWQCATAPDLANITFAHESAHFLIGKMRGAGANSEDGDSLPDALENEVGLLHYLTNNGGAFLRPECAHTYPKFNGSRGSTASPDEEFYCWINGSFGATTNNVYKHKPMQSVPDQPLQLQDIGAPPYTQAGQPLPTVAKNAFDWSVGGQNWRAP